MRSPKLGGSADAQYYRYYAGYTQGFVEDVISSLALPQSAVVLDPWNGAGTTTSAAAHLGMAARGFDLNPAAVTIGRARLLGAEVSGSIAPLAAEICDRAQSHPVNVEPGDLLAIWFGARTATELRSLERAVHRILVRASDDETEKDCNPAPPHSSLAALFYVALFRTVRDLVRRYVPSNPSWIKAPTGRRVGVSRRELHAFFVDAAQRSDPHLVRPVTSSSMTEPSIEISMASSTQLPIQDGEASAVVASPPYLTRIDYVKATLPELAVLGLTADDVQRLRERMIGTPLTANRLGGDISEWGDKTAKLVEEISSHPSKASATYYRRYYLQYFDGMWSSLKELRRVLSPGGSAVLVVQDSYYKEIHVDLPALIEDMGSAAGWRIGKRVDFRVPRTMASINPASRKYRTDFRATESAVLLER